jgi:hypothetical protein
LRVSQCSVDSACEKLLATQDSVIVVEPEM